MRIILLYKPNNFQLFQRIRTYDEDFFYTLSEVGIYIYIRYPSLINATEEYNKNHVFVDYKVKIYK